VKPSRVKPGHAETAPDFLPARALSAPPSSPRTPPDRGRQAARHGAWRGGRVVDRTALEMRHRCKPIGGSNPSLSASKSLILHYKTYQTKLWRYFRQLATVVAGVGH
jgi:hypothetical protein